MSDTLKKKNHTYKVYFEWDGEGLSIQRLFA